MNLLAIMLLKIERDWEQRSLRYEHGHTTVNSQPTDCSTPLHTTCGIESIDGTLFTVQHSYLRKNLVYTTVLKKKCFICPHPKSLGGAESFKWLEGARPVDGGFVALPSHFIQSERGIFADKNGEIRSHTLLTRLFTHQEWKANMRAHSGSGEA